MTEQAHSASSPPRTRGLRAKLVAARLATGTGAPKRAPRFTFVLLALSAAVLACAPAALAAAPETPELTVEEPVHATTATFLGVINPGKEGGFGTFEAGTYEFLYKKSATECAGEGKSPASPGITLGGGQEHLPAQTVTGLAPSTQYTVCLQARSGTAGETALSAPVTFMTATPAEEPKTGAAKSVTATSEILEGVLDPKAAPTAKAGWYFAYSFGAKCTSGGQGGGETAHEGEVEGKAVAEKVEAAGLEPNKKYLFCMVATDDAGDPTVGNAVSFTTAKAPPALIIEDDNGVKDSEATLQAEINPQNEATSDVFEYATSEAALLEGTGTKVAGKSLSGFPPEGVQGFVESVVLKGLAPGTTYFYRVVAENGQSKTEKKPVLGAAQSITTAPTPTTDPVTELTATTATFNGSLTPLNETVPTQDDFIYALGSECFPPLEPFEQTPLEEAGIGKGTPATGIARVTGLQPNHEYTVCFVSANSSGSEEAAPVHFTTAEVPPKIDSETVSAVTPEEATLEAHVNPNNLKTTYTFEYATSEAALLAGEGKKLPGGALEGYGDQTASAPTGAVLTAGETYFYRVVVESTASKEVIDGVPAAFTPQGSPLAVTAAAQNVTRTTANLSGTVSPAGSETHYHFAYIEQSAYEEALAANAENPWERARETPEETLPAGYAPHATGSVLLSNLPPGRTFVYALVASSEPGVNTTSVPRTFTTSPATPPQITGLAAGAITSSSATITATLQPNNLSTRWELQLGSNPAALQPITSGQATTETPLSIPVGNLTPGTVYYYRLTAVSSDGTLEPEGSFATAPGPAAAASGSLPALIPYTPISTIEAKETAENKKNSKPPVLTKKQKLAKALAACHKDTRRSKRQSCERAAHKRYPTAKRSAKKS